MTGSNGLNEEPFDFERLLPAAVAQALGDEDPAHFQAWLRRHLPEFAAPELTRQAAPGLLAAMATQLSSMIWNALPLPGNGFRPRPIPPPGRNDPCPCGSGRKYKQCCSAMPKLPPLDPQLLWPLVIDRLPERRLGDALSHGQIPLEGVIAVAIKWQEEERTSEAAGLLEPLFAELARKPRPEHDLALQMLCDLYDELDRRDDKLALLSRVTSQAPASFLRAGAWQRLATIELDRGDPAAARQALERAMRDDPNDPAAALIEVQIYGFEERWEQARDRARFWLKRLNRPIYDSEAIAPLRELLEGVVDDPREAIRDMLEEPEPFEEDLDEASSRLLDWVDEIARRPLPSYQAREESSVAESPEGLAGRLRAMGLAPEEVEEALAALDAGAESTEDGETSPMADEDDSSLVLKPPKSLRKVESRWQEVAGLAKPFGIQDQPLHDWGGWDLEEAPEWLDFLQQHPAAGDSLEVIDDLTTAIFSHPDGPSPTIFFEGILPLLQRARAIIEKALEKTQAPRLLWNRLDNRVALRCLVRLYQVYLFNLEDQDEARRLRDWLLDLNPDDNHGLRCGAVNDHLRHGQDRQAIELADRFPDDLFAETRYGQVLALYRLNRLQSAQEAAEIAVDDMPRVARALVRSRVRRPEISPHGITPGGDDQAWLYREEMREVWQQTPGALDWLKKIMKLKGVSAR